MWDKRAYLRTSELKSSLFSIATAMRGAVAQVTTVGLFVALLAGMAEAQSSWFSNWRGEANEPSTPRPAVVRVIAEDADGNSQGSGTLVAVSEQHGIVVTNWHVVRDATGRIRVIFPDGFESAAQVLKTDSEWDLAALGIWRPSTAPVPIAHVAPVAGEPLTIAGYGSGSYREATGRLTQYVAPASHLPYEMFEVDVEARNGDSGGPILNTRGELAGVLFGAASGTTAGSFCGRVRRFVDSVLPLIDPAARQRAAFAEGLASKQVEPAARTPSPPAIQPVPITPSPQHSSALALASPATTDNSPPGTPAPPMRPVQLPDERVSPAPVSSVRSRPLAPPPPVRTTSRVEPSAGARAVSALKVLGATPLDQIKTFLAIVGVVSIVMQVTGGRRKES